jgi:4-hydroxybenzoate polyprenyltransferase
MSTSLTSWLQLIRLPAGFSVVSNVLVAHTLATHGVIQWNGLVFTLIASLCLYYGGMVLNDCFDYSEDCRERPQRPLPSQQVTLNTAWMVGCVLMLLGCLSAALVNQRMLVVSVVLALLIVVYDSNRLPAWFRAITMGLCRYVNWLLAMAVLPLSASSILLPLPVFCYVVGLTRLSQVEMTEASRFRVYELLFILMFPLVILIALAKFSVLSVIVMIVLGGYYLSLILPLLNPHTPAQVQQTVGRLVFGLMPLDAAIGFVFGYWGVSCIVLLLIPLPRLIGSKLYVS